MSSLRQLGASVEDQVAQYLLAQGYTLLSRRLHVGHSELDLVALDEDIVVFVEVKYRKNDLLLAVESIGPAKIAYLKRAAEQYVFEHQLQQHPVRFDVVAVTREGIRHFKNAFA